MRLHQIDTKGKWLGTSKTELDTAGIPRGWLASEAEPLQGQRWGGNRGWIGEPTATNDDARLDALYHAAMKQQSQTCDSNFYGLLTAIAALSQGTGQPVPEKAAACIEWLESLWSDYHSRKATGSTDYDFSAYGRCPFTFLEVRAE